MCILQRKSYMLRRSSLRIHQGSFVIHHSSFIIRHSSFIIRHICICILQRGYISFLCRNRCFGYVKWIYEAETLECVCVCESVCVCVCSRAYACRENTIYFVSYFIKNQSKMVSRAALDGSRDQRNWSFYDVNWTFCKKGCVFAREWRTSMSPRSNEKHTFFEN